MLKNPNLSKYENLRFYDFFQNVLTILERAGEPTLLPHLTPLTEMVSLLAAGVELDRDNLLTANITAADKRRDNAVDGIRRLVSAYELHFEADKQEAATLLMRSFKKLGNIARLPYNDQSSAVRTLLRDWEEASHAAAVTTLGLQAWRTELKTAQIEFDNLFLTRVESEASKTALPIYKLRPDATKVYNNLAILLMAFAQMNPTAYAPIIELMNELIQKFNTAFLLGRTDDEEKKETSTDTAS